MDRIDIIIVVFNRLNYDARAYNLATLLQQLGYSITVISIDNNGTQNYPFRNIKVKINENRRLIFKWIFFWSKVRKILKTLKFDTYIASDLYSLSNISLLDSRVNVIYDSREIYSALASLSNRKLSQLFITIIEKLLLKKVNKIIVSGELDKEILSQNTNFNKPFYIIKNLPYHIDNRKSKYLRNKFDIPDNYIIAIYQGMIINNRGIIQFLNTLQYFDNIYFIMIGENQIQDALNKSIIEFGLQSRCSIHSPVDYPQLLEITKSADFGVALFEQVSQSYQFALPNKLFEYIACGIPYIATNLPAIQILNSDIQAGVLIKNVNIIKDIEIGIRELVQNYDYYRNNAIANKDKFSYNSQIDEIKRLIDCV